MEYYTRHVIRVEKLESRCKLYSERERPLNQGRYSSYRFAPEKLSMKKVLGFLGLASEFSEFEMEPGFLAIGFAIAFFLQFVQQNADQDGSILIAGNRAPSRRS